MPSQQPVQQPVTPTPDPTLGDTATLVAMDVMPEQPVASPDPPPPPSYGYDAVETA